MVLSGWKEIAKYLGLGVRTVQRWEDKGLPVNRPYPGRHATVVAHSEQLDKWVERFSRDGDTKTQDVVARAKQRYARLEKTGAKFFTTDLDLAMTLTRIASDARKGSERRTRNQASARRAYDEVSRISRHAWLTANERQHVNDKLGELRSALEKLGEVFV